GYELHEVLGRGGFATVYRATQTSVDRLVALKVLTAAALDPNTERRFRHEVRAVGALSDHPHVVALIDAGTTTTGAPFISMQLVPAGSFGDQMRAFGPLEPTEAARVGAEVADALEAAHEAGILHRDIKPDNILVGRRGRALLTDFGIATLDDGTMTVTGTLTGTLAYTAPEVIKGERPSAASDVFALGATLYTLVAGRPAFATGEDHVAAVMWRVTTEDAPPLPPEVPFALADLIGACMAKEADERPPLAEAATALEAIAASRAAAPTATATVDPDEPPTLDALDEATVVAPPPPPVDAAATVVAPTDDAATVVAPSTGGSAASATAPDPADATRVAPPAPAAPPGASPAPPPGTRRGRGRLLAVAALVVVVVLVAAGLVLALGGGDDDSGRGGEELVIDVGANPTAIATGIDGVVWVANRDDGTVTRLGADGEDLGTTEVGGGPTDIAATDSAVWVVNTDDSTMTELTPEGDEVSTENVGEASSAVAATEDVVWVASPVDEDIARILPEDFVYDSEAVTEVDYESAHLAIAGDGSVWAALALTEGGGLLLHADTEFNVIVRQALDAAPSGIVVTDDDVWVALGQGAEVGRFDPESGEVIGSVPLEGSELGELVLAPNGDLWVSDLSTGDGAVALIDTNDEEVAETVPVGVRERAFTVTDGAIWVAVPGDGTVRRIPL
ncbi:MAG TPA: serine/threonine-protein kinase, partial [Iamia sp.]|nr:serine/threonine-protein kinase [Iamia sp.]